MGGYTLGGLMGSLAAYGLNTDYSSVTLGTTKATMKVWSVS